jgi:hypothetical protein
VGADAPLPFLPPSSPSSPEFGKKSKIHDGQHERLSDWMDGMRNWSCALWAWGNWCALFHTSSTFVREREGTIIMDLFVAIDRRAHHHSLGWTGNNCCQTLEMAHNKFLEFWWMSRFSSGINYLFKWSGYLRAICTLVGYLALSQGSLSLHPLFDFSLLYMLHIHIHVDSYCCLCESACPCGLCNGATQISMDDNRILFLLSWFRVPWMAKRLRPPTFH